MSKYELSESVRLVQERLTALRIRLETGNAAAGSPDNASTLSDLHELLDTLQARYGLLREIFDRTTDMVFAKDRDGLYVMINARGADMLKKTQTEVLGADDRALLERAEAEQIVAIDREVMSTGEPRTMEQTRDLQGVRTTLLTTMTAWYEEERRVCGVIGIAQDVTENRRIQLDATTHRDRMRSITVEIVISEERLRRLLASELHDGIGQDIALAKMKLSALRSTASEDMSAPLAGIEQLIEQADRSLRSITYQISPPSLHDLGLVAALQWLGEDISRKYGMVVHIEDRDSPGIADERVRVILFRAVRELLVNAATHARVGQATVQLARQEGLVHITVADAGAGFDTAGLDQRGHGLFAISEQLNWVDGSIHVASAVGRGTTVTLTAPAPEAVAAPTT